LNAEVKEDEIGRACSTNGEEEEEEEKNACRSLVGHPEGSRTLGRRGRRWVDNIKIDFSEA
jgi:hypothetical protein